MPPLLLQKHIKAKQTSKQTHVSCEESSVSEQLTETQGEEGFAPARGASWPPCPHLGAAQPSRCVSGVVSLTEAFLTCLFYFCWFSNVPFISQCCILICDLPHD